jgi:hypothetical protein
MCSLSRFLETMLNRLTSAVSVVASHISLVAIFIVYKRENKT